MTPIFFWSERKKAQNGCLVCGICCDFYGGILEARPADLERWRAEGRKELLARVGPGGILWLDLSTGERLENCPFLARLGAESAVCRIHDTKPQVCRDYPTPHHGLRCIRGKSF